ncbi:MULTISPECIES: glycosyltransferase [unclassified Novosphingobium]|uniref:glycosyltransferase n=1 Tax=unclassified Novosphingobium TaxID=2644732 RepID=UPI001444B697|nr:cellulose synthase/poly-beta-1,6-N-acetylglucosamine synthase-like glycosyltransferase/peptidoglycan/xylan/chitin deacetylase (PgdA/CDA1 family)/spore germination protein YaaH [Novosphingobium sp. SG720]NMN05565.1 cellulose synthase/poly-beta-1,6-N-acetylglucosamine synthase-like glycosyltransferase/peptidoglycan/xylan/chitin deacetylase (PgdA/CDA1 family)/spore germination protein YaaH [Novosphingobium sp. SG919]NMN88076.1 cellulose synthase/poly-beta-1,6-N-acetylglucosamine synthase-like gly
MPRPIFFDPTGQRRRWTRRLAFAVLAVLVAMCVIFATTVATVTPREPLAFAQERLAPLPLKTQVSRLSHRLAALFGHRAVVPARVQAAPITIGFYQAQSDESAGALQRHVGQIDWVAPTLMGLDHAGHLTVTDDAPMRRIIAGSLRRPLVVPVLQNVSDAAGWDGAGTAAVLNNPARRLALANAVDAALDKSGDAGVMIDFESLPQGALPGLHQFAADLHARLAPKHRLVSITMPVDDENWHPRAFADVADKIVLMAYDEHWQGGQSGPIASNPWFIGRVSAALKGVPAGKAVVALGSYGYDWHEGHADALTVEEAWLAAHDSGTTPGWDKASGNVGFAYDDDADTADGTPAVRHDVWLLDAATSWNQMLMLRQLGVGSVALWRLGSEDPGFWPVLQAWHGGAKTLPDISRITQSSNVDVEGNGEILRIDATPTPGTRSLDTDHRLGLVTDERYVTLPTPYVVRRTGDRPKLVALTFDDGPDPTWTPQILSILEKYHVPGTFFVIGENGVANRGLLQRMVADGDEIGNHSYTHPNMANSTPAGIKLELNATQRLIEAYTGRSTRLFRAPYFGDAEPTTADELDPALIAQKQGYTIVGLHADPGDWMRRPADQVVQLTVSAVDGGNADRSANVILLHDGGGNRSQTVAALPRIIEQLQAQGYRFVPVSTLAGMKRDDVMPVVKGWDLVAVQLDIGIFAVLAAALATLNWTFFFAIALGTLRALGLTGLALFPQRRVDLPWLNRAPDVPPYQPRVTVIIPAYNEERVIEASVHRILASTYPALSVIVADDGSKDATSQIVTDAFGGDPRVTLMTLVNGGKASALNRALAAADGEIIVALDADTQFEPETIGKLVRWFEKPEIGAVAGNAKVGNRVNLVTRWQAVEYVTAQNIERRALTRFDAIMVVPGAVGAWRREALNDVGGYPEDTLAEDQDLTIAIQRHGWKVAYDEDAVAWTEAPETLRALGKQRFRWAFGTLQCLWKHRAVVAQQRPSGLAFIGIPQAWLFQIAFAIASPLIDLALGISIVGTIVRVIQHGWAQTQTDVLRMGVYWLGFTLIDLACGLVAFRLDVREKRLPAFLLLSQRFVYRQLMYGVVIRAVSAALAGLGIGWGKLERTGRVNTGS